MGKDEPKWVPLFFFFNDTATPEIYTLSLHDALPILKLRGERTEAHAHPQRRLAPEQPDQGHHHLAHRHGVFPGLDVQVGDACGPMMQQEVGDHLELRAVTVERLVVPAHPAIIAVLTAEIRDLHDSADEHLPAELLRGQFSRHRVPASLFSPAGMQHRGIRKESFSNHWDYQTGNNSAGQTIFRAQSTT